MWISFFYSPPPFPFHPYHLPQTNIIPFPNPPSLSCLLFPSPERLILCLRRIHLWLMPVQSMPGC